MNYFTESSIELANQKDYLDQLFKVYPLAPDSIRKVDSNLWKSIQQYYESGNNINLFRTLLELDLFPIKDGYVPYFRRDVTAIERNPNTVNRICGRIKEIGLEKLYEKCTQPKETNRQMGPLFKKWIKSGVLGISPVNENDFLNSGPYAVLDGSDQDLMTFATKYLGYTRNKGLDFLGKFNGTYIIGEAKFISDEGGHQNDQFEDALLTINSQVHDNVMKIGILDGVLYIPGRKKMYTRITSSDVPVMSALLLRDFLYSL